MCGLLYFYDDYLMTEGIIMIGSFGNAGEKDRHRQTFDFFWSFCSRFVSKDCFIKNDLVRVRFVGLSFSLLSFEVL